MQMWSVRSSGRYVSSSPLLHFWPICRSNLDSISSARCFCPPRVRAPLPPSPLCPSVRTCPVPRPLFPTHLAHFLPPYHSPPHTCPLTTGIKECCYMFYHVACSTMSHVLLCHMFYYATCSTMSYFLHRYQKMPSPKPRSTQPLLPANLKAPPPLEWSLSTLHPRSLMSIRVFKTLLRQLRLSRLSALLAPHHPLSPLRARIARHWRSARKLLHRLWRSACLQCLRCLSRG